MTPERQAAAARLAILPGTLANALGISDIGVRGYRLFLDELLRNAGNPTDPVEIMLLEQMAMCHFRAAVLQGQAAEAEGLASIAMYNAAAARLVGEFRKIVLVLNEYRRR